MGITGVAMGYSHSKQAYLLGLPDPPSIESLLGTCIGNHVLRNSSLRSLKVPRFADENPEPLTLHSKSKVLSKKLIPTP